MMPYTDALKAVHGSRTVMPYTDVLKAVLHTALCRALQGEHKKVAPPMTFVDISAMREDFCVKFYTTV